MNFPNRHFLGFLCLASTLVWLTETRAGEPKELTTRLQIAESVSELPQNVYAESGALTLVADYSDVRGEHVVLYLVNRTDQRIAFSAQDGDPYVKLEIQNDSGFWRRSQKHYSEWCGNSYDRAPSLRPGQFFRFLGYYPATGEPAAVRYRIYQDVAYILEDDAPERLQFQPGDKEKLPINLVTNASQGFVKTSDLAEVRYDSMAIRYGPFEDIREMAAGRAKPTYYARWSQLGAIRALQRFPTDEAAVVLMDLLDNDNQHIRSKAIQGLAVIGPHSPKAEKRFQDLLQDEDLERRSSAIASLAARPLSLDVVEYVKPLLDHHESLIRMAAVAAISMSCKEFPQAYELLNSHRNDPDPEVRSLIETFLNERLGWGCTPTETNEGS